MTDKEKEGAPAKGGFGPQPVFPQDQITCRTCCKKRHYLDPYCPSCGTMVPKSEPAVAYKRA